MRVDSDSRSTVLTPKGVGESIYSGFTHNPHHLILDSVLWVFTRLVCN